ncbi:2-octaprenyl-3-methyl-6-methoxy-1,4-benzoquinol hydroxylase [Thaumasiovibrio sp. DFM-14]|uniref:2-octaprenyl-3-methyl-6-methoxy-1,4-benzoquinol hydroxylase n=1 Tax=Thaumasiovibrio sp. DFM-14 TaxID=3384792 RepID=UPI0039A09586
MKKIECIVVGGGMVGAAVALGLAQQGKDVVLIEGQPPTEYASSQPMDLRVSAISAKSVALLQQLGAWDALQEMRLCPYQRLEAWDNPACRTRFEAKELNRDWLGYIVENRLLQLALWQQFHHYDNLALEVPQRMRSINSQPDYAEVTLDNGQCYQAKMVIAADGALSRVRQSVGIGVTSWDYRHHCMLINIKSALPQQDITWQQFTPQGPRAFLPLAEQHGSLVWYDSPSRIAQLSRLSDEQLTRAIQTTFPAELGEFSIEKHGHFPLTRRHAQQYHHHRVVLIGDAAHTINPLAGQGVNLGFKDVEALLTLSAKVDDFSSPGSLLQQYAQQRRPDNLMMQSAMDLFYKAFSNDLLPAKLLRNTGLLIANHAGPLKRQALRYAMGL